MTKVRQTPSPENALDVFLEKRVDLIIEDLKDKLPIPNFEVIDTAYIEGSLNEQEM